MKHFLAGLLSWAHTLIVIFTLVGWLGPWPWFLGFHAAMMVAMKWHWSRNENQCILTKWEKALRDGEDVGPVQDDSNPFVANLDDSVLDV